MFAALHAPGNLALLLECARHFSPRVEETTADTVVVDLSGLEFLFGTPEEIARDMRSRLGEGVNIAVADNPDAAVHAALGLPGLTVIPRGKEAATLAPLPLNLLPGSPETAGLLDAWGVRTFGQLAALPPLGVAARLGEEGRHLQRLARGEETRQLRTLDDPLRFQDERELDYPIELLDQLSFVLSQMLHDLTARLASRALATNALQLRLKLEGGREHETRLEMPVPVRDPMALLKLLQLELGARPPQSAVLTVFLWLNPLKPRTQQHGLFQPVSPEPEKLEITLARLSNLLGADNVGTPELLDTHRPDAFQMVRFVPRDQEVAQTAYPGMVLRRFRPFKYAQVLLAGGRPTHISSLSIKGEVLACAGPWRTSGDWWTSEPWERDEWDVALSDGALYRLHHDLQANRWFFEGSYD